MWETPETLTFISWVISWIWLCSANTEQPGLRPRWGARLNWGLIISYPAVVCKHSEKASPPSSCKGPKKSLTSTVLTFERCKTKHHPSSNEFGTNINCSETPLPCLLPKPQGQQARVGLTSLSPSPDAAWICPGVHGGWPPAFPSSCSCWFRDTKQRCFRRGGGLPATSQPVITLCRGADLSLLPRRP